MAETFRCLLTNPSGDRLTYIAGSNTQEQPYVRAAREVNAHAEHSRFGPWTVIGTERHS